MADVVLIPVGSDIIALDRQTFDEARERAREIVAPFSTDSVAAPERLLTAEALARLLAVPVSQVEALGRQGRLPSVQIGKYRRYAYSQALAAFRETK